MSTVPGETEAEEIQEVANEGGLFGLFKNLFVAAVKVAQGDRLQTDRTDPDNEAAADIAALKNAVARSHRKETV